MAQSAADALLVQVLFNQKLVELRSGAERGEFLVLHQLLAVVKSLIESLPEIARGPAVIFPAAAHVLAR